MSIVELINKVGVENVLIQPLHGSVTNCQLVGKRGRDSRVTFVTDANNFRPSDLLGIDRERIGLILWFDKPKDEPIDQPAPTP